MLHIDIQAENANLQSQKSVFGLIYNNVLWWRVHFRASTREIPKSKCWHTKNDKTKIFVLYSLNEKQLRNKTENNLSAKICS